MLILLWIRIHIANAMASKLLSLLFAKWQVFIIIPTNVEKFAMKFHDVLLFRANLFSVCLCRTAYVKSVVLVFTVITPSPLNVN